MTLTACSPADLDQADLGTVVRVTPARNTSLGWLGWVRPASEWPELIREGFYDFTHYVLDLDGTKIALWDDDLIERIA